MTDRERIYPSNAMLPADVASAGGRLFVGPRAAVHVGAFQASPEGLLCQLDIVISPPREVLTSFAFAGASDRLPDNELRIWLVLADGAPIESHIRSGGGGSSDGHISRFSFALWFPADVTCGPATVHVAWDELDPASGTIEISAEALTEASARAFSVPF